MTYVCRTHVLPCFHLARFVSERVARETWNNSKPEFTPLTEKGNVGQMELLASKSLAPGWGSSGFYSESVLKRDIPKAFPLGTHMNVESSQLSAKRPSDQRATCRNLAAILTSFRTVSGRKAASKGPGVYVRMRNRLGGYVEAIDEIGEHIGVSIRGRGKSSMGEADGKEGRIIDEVTDGLSVDFVTSPGAGGAIIQVFEAAPNNDAAARCNGSG